MAKFLILNWYAKNPKLVKGLKTRLDEKKGAEDFVTIRLGTKWANKLVPGQRVAISISDSPKKPQIVGYACVVSVAKTWLVCVTNDDLKHNIGAKNIDQACEDMKSVYGPKNVSENSVVSVIRLIRVK